jgi:hypothetical protein
MTPASGLHQRLPVTYREDPSMGELDALIQIIRSRRREHRTLACQQRPFRDPVAPHRGLGRDERDGGQHHGPVGGTEISKCLPSRPVVQVCRCLSCAQSGFREVELAVTGADQEGPPLSVGERQDGTRAIPRVSDSHCLFADGNLKTVATRLRCRALAPTVVS